MVGVGNLILIVYALVLWFVDFKSKAGIIIAISVAAMDLFNFLLYNSKMVSTPS